LLKSISIQREKTYSPKIFREKLEKGSENIGYKGEANKNFPGDKNKGEKDKIVGVNSLILLTRVPRQEIEGQA